MLDERQLADAEYETWQDVVTVWRAEVGEINDPKYRRLVKAIQRWGEYLATLRRGQGEGRVRDIRDDMDRDFNLTA